jgi:hypothetical protein
MGVIFGAHINDRTPLGRQNDIALLNARWHCYRAVIVPSIPAWW